VGLSISQLHVRRSMLIMASPERVWSEFKTYKSFSDWFGNGHQLDTYEPHHGGRVELSVVIDGESTSFGGDILVFEPARELSFTNNWFTDQAWPSPTFITLRLAPCYEGTMVELFHHGFERLGKDAANTLQDYEDGWDSHHLVLLRDIIEQGSIVDDDPEALGLEDW
jgi:uncharacterized protein YndB with AHSA1/START domain